MLQHAYGIFGGTNTTKRGVVKLRFEFNESQYLEAINLLKFLNKNVTIEFENKEGNNELVGNFSMSECKFTKNLETKILLETTADQVRPTSLQECADQVMNIILEVEDEV